MQLSIDAVFARLEDKKRQLKDRKARAQDDLRNNSRYTEIVERMAELKAERKAIEMEIVTQADRDEMEDMKVDIKTDKILLTDLTLNKYVSGETVEVIDEYHRSHNPIFSVTFKKS